MREVEDLERIIKQALLSVSSFPPRPAHGTVLWRRWEKKWYGEGGGSLVQPCRVTRTGINPSSSAKPSSARLGAFTVYHKPCLIRSSCAIFSALPTAKASKPAGGARPYGEEEKALGTYVRKGRAQKSVLHRSSLPSRSSSETPEKDGGRRPQRRLTDGPLR